MSDNLDTKSRMVVAMPVNAREPVMSSGLDYAVDRFSYRGDEAFVLLAPAHREEAAQVLLYYDRATGPLRLDAVTMWLRQLAGAVSKPPTTDEFDKRLASVMLTCGDICVAAWTTKTCVEFSRGCKWWPGDAEIDEFLRPISNGFKAKHRALARVVKTATVPIVARQKPTEEEKAAVASSVTAAISYLNGQVGCEAGNVRSVPPAHVSDERLLIEYERTAQQQGPFQGLAKTRVAMLRKKLGLAVPAATPDQHRSYQLEKETAP